MDFSALLLSRLQFAFTVSFHIVFPSFTIGLAAWLTVLEALHLAAGRPAHRILFLSSGSRFSASPSGSASSRAPSWPSSSARIGPSSRVHQDQYRGRFSPMRPSRPLRSRQAFLAFFCLAADEWRRGSICSRPRWSGWAQRSPRSGSWSTTAGCRRQSATPSRTALASPSIGARSFSARSCGSAFRTCFSPRT
jgi:hypothetical protein